MAAFVKFQPFIEDVWEGVHNFGANALMAFLCATANQPAVGNRVLADITQISYTNLSARAITTASSVQTAGVYKLTLTDLVLTASGPVAAFQYAGFYNDSPSSPLDPLCGYWDYGSAVTLANGETFTYDFDSSAGVIQSQ